MPKGIAKGNTWIRNLTNRVILPYFVARITTCFTKISNCLNSKSSPFLIDWFERYQPLWYIYNQCNLKYISMICAPITYLHFKNIKTGGGCLPSVISNTRTLHDQQVVTISLNSPHNLQSEWFNDDHACCLHNVRYIIIQGVSKKW